MLLVRAVLFRHRSAVMQISIFCICSFDNLRAFVLSRFLLISYLVHYEMRLASGERNGQVVESTFSSERPYSFKLGVGHVIQGLDLAVATMSVGERSLFFIAPQLGYVAETL